MITSVPAELDRAAEGYEAAAGQLRAVLARLPDYLAELDAAKEVNWDSMTSDAYRSVLALLRAPAELMMTEVAALAAEADGIAADLRSYAQQARYLGSLLSLTNGVPAGLEAAGDWVEGLWRDSTEALSSSAARFTEFIDRHGGIPTVLEQMLR
ncbi:hypothetical protein [Nesterenkonia sphaerica]|uniref:WXG100 family type VII secretion target n=1 Tax=Nesterenkonia sphaerica TaxID=1804988 RepID=A0A5R9AK72_9MICC|nr:hypothetical protein [Nesterenkonia sphaerica]TLP78973.1 hypothetical protein FEF27_03730 [Nesterenkonia sphaerica]